MAVDRPGFGYSGRPRDGASPVVQARLLHAAVQMLGVERPVLVAQSRGVSIALAYALHHPGEVAGVVDLGGYAFFGTAWAPWYTRLLMVPVLGALLAHTIYVPCLGRRAVEAGLRAVFAPEGAPPLEYVRAYAAMILRPTSMRALADDQLHSTRAMQAVMARYPELQVPLVIINGTADASTPIEQARRLHRIVPGSRLAVPPGAGHEVMFFHPDKVMQGIDAVLQQGPA